MGQLHVSCMIVNIMSEQSCREQIGHVLATLSFFVYFMDSLAQWRLSRDSRVMYLDTGNV